MNYTIKNERITATVSSLGAELISVVGDDGFEYIWDSTGTEFWDGHAPVLFPACGRTLNNTYTYKGVSYEMVAHGFAPRSEFSLVEKSDDRLVLSLTPTDEIKAKNYPFDFELVAEFRVEENRLFANFTVHNRDKVELPYMFGWHPAFTLEGVGGSSIYDFTVAFKNVDSVTWHPLQNGPFVNPVGKPYPLKNSAYPLHEKEIYENDTMIFVGAGYECLLSAPMERHGVKMSYSENIPYFCIWKEPSSEARYVCLEPWGNVPSGGDAPEVYETKTMARLPVGKSEVYAFEVEFFAK
ncbi:MAG: hypothetical protein J6C39_02360 [Clostridia bacterium]|nr:hypothetical protein [Clostridia bacterium]MBO5207200.1 hypothetical protein [Clostridia bacterium]